MCKKVETDEKSICFNNNLFLPVIRYQGIYHPETKKKNFCGTFFYVEPESTVLLNLGKCSVFATKIHAYIALLAQISNLSREEVLNEHFKLDPESKFAMTRDIWIKTFEVLKEYINNIVNENKIKESMIAFYIPLLHKESDVKEIPLIETTALYPTDPAKYWKNEGSKNKKPNSPYDEIDENYRDDEKEIILYIGIHDDYDQKICKMARELKIDTIVFQHEIGETRAVTEILDTRDNTYDHLVRVNVITKPWYKISKKYPTIWFLDNGFITNMKCKKIDIDRDDLNIVKCE